MTSVQYPDDLNPFGSDDEDEDGKKTDNGPTLFKDGHKFNSKSDDQFHDNHNSLISNETKNASPTDEYPDYLSPFGDHEADDYDNSLNPFEAEAENNGEVDNKLQEQQQLKPNPDTTNTSQHEQQAQQSSNSQPDDSLEPPPKPLPRIKKLLKKEQALKHLNASKI